MEIEKMNVLIVLLNGLLYKIKSKNAELILIEEPILHEKNASEDEKEILSINWSENRIPLLQSNPSFIRNAYFKELNEEYAKLIFSGPNARIKNCYYINNDYQNEYVSVINGYRKNTEYLFDKHIKIFGSSRVYSFGCEDSETLTAFLQKKASSKNYKVLNYGVRGQGIENAIYTALDVEVNQGDIFILYDFGSLKEMREHFIDTIKKNGFNFLSLRNVFLRSHSYGEVFFDYGHLGPRGNKIVAEKIWCYLECLIDHNYKEDGGLYDKKHNFERSQEFYERVIENRRLLMAGEVNEYLPSYLKSLKKYKKENQELGAIVMNCNPFTFGHQYLIEYAAKKVDSLIIFVVEEDMSYFKFEHRIEMVRRGVQHLNNVIVLPSSKFIISSVTFPEYFSKESKNEIVNASHDLEIFAYYIAPTLNIKTRFVGEEPSCQVTLGYNQQMKEILGNAGIFVEEIERKGNSEGPISASKVRRYLETNNISNLYQYVPKTTLQFLKDFEYIKIP